MEPPPPPPISVKGYVNYDVCMWIVSKAPFLFLGFWKYVILIWVPKLSKNIFWGIIWVPKSSKNIFWWIIWVPKSRKNKMDNSGCQISIYQSKFWKKLYHSKIQNLFPGVNTFFSAAFSKAFRDVRLPCQIVSFFDEICAVRKFLVSAFKRRKGRQNPMRSDRVH